jgi:hypothetical protein
VCTDNVMELRINGTEGGTICKCIAFLPGCVLDGAHWDFNLRIDSKPDLAARLCHAIGLDLLRPLGVVMSTKQLSGHEHGHRGLKIEIEGDRR